MPEVPPYLRSLGSRFLDLLYPPVCSACGEALDQGRSLCEPCDEALPRLAEPFCTTCGEGFEGRIEGPFRCPNCHDLSFSFRFARPALFRDERSLDLVHRLKYGRQIHVARELGRLVAEALETDPRFATALAQGWPLVPVPLHRTRLARRGFNQAAEIARHAALLRGLPLLHALRRVRPTTTQTALTRQQRLNNLRGAFATSRAWSKQAPPAGLILIDDVLTTGSTLDACAKVLRRAGTRQILAATVLRG